MGIDGIWKMLAPENTQIVVNYVAFFFFLRYITVEFSSLAL